jgi:rare lipoprotein A
LTAAHPTLPFNSMVKVTNISNGLSVTVRINDRGPSNKKYCIDLSMAAAKLIDIEKIGAASVKIETVK